MSHEGLGTGHMGTRFAALLLAALLLVPVGAAAAEPVGRVLVAVGDATATQEGASARGLGRGDPIRAGDTIRTGERGRVQMRFRDGAMVDLEPGSRFEVEAYSGSDGDGSVVMSFLRGAMRTITGAIGADSGENYRMNTTVATIGVRGTAYALHYCDAACVDAGGRPGLYGRVDEGTITAEGAFGRFSFAGGDYFFIPENGAPRRIVAPPEGILGGDDASARSGSDEQIEDVEIRPLDIGEEFGGDFDDEASDLLRPGFEAGDALDRDDLTGSNGDADGGGDFEEGGGDG